MNKKMSKRQKDIKSKLMAAICMLLVSSIMMVSSTYAWFTLSTAPEVTGIQTAVGANGNLEMALIPAEGLPLTAAQDYGITTNVGDSSLADNLRNVTWGNLVDLSKDEFYGMDQITLYPAALNATMDAANLNPTALALSVLKTPAYGADGRVSELLENTTTGILETEGFTPSEKSGVRAVGTASGMTPRQLAYRNARSAASTAMAQAKTFAAQSLNTNGSALANIALNHGIDGAAKHTEGDVKTLLAIVDDLLGDGTTTGVLQYVENAYKNYVIAMGASKAATTAGMTDELFTAFQADINSATTVEELITKLANYGTVGVDTTAMSALAATKAKVATAKTGLKALLTNDDAHEDTEKYIEWASISTPLGQLADTSAMKINGFAASQVEANLSAIVTTVANGGGITVTIATGGGVYADVADHCGNFNAQITIDKISYGDLGPFTNLTARMETATTVSPVYLAVMGAAVEAALAPEGAGTVMPITDFFGYIVDLAFKTNADASNLLLQTDAVNRIYSQDGAEEAMGHGSTMTFTSTTTDFTADDMAGLMDAIRIVFFNPTDRSVYATAKLDMTDGNYEVVGGNSITAKIYLYKNTASTTEYVAESDKTLATHVQVVTYEAVIQGQTGTHISDGAGGYREITGEEVGTHVQDITYQAEDTAADNGTHKAVITPGSAEMITTQKDAIITALTQNTAQAVSCLVYLDGNKVTNADVAATAATSMTGSMNLQFASSATLVPMDYTPLKGQGTATPTTEATPETTVAGG